MIKIYSMPSCKDCQIVKQQIEGKEGYQVIDITASTANLKEFLKIRDHSEVFDEIRKAGKIGIPCFVFEDGYVSLNKEDANLYDEAVAHFGCENGNC